MGLWRRYGCRSSTGLSSIDGPWMLLPGQRDALLAAQPALVRLGAADDAEQTVEFPSQSLRTRRTSPPSRHGHSAGRHPPLLSPARRPRQPGRIRQVRICDGEAYEVLRRVKRDRGYVGTHDQRFMDKSV